MEASDPTISVNVQVMSETLRRRPFRTPAKLLTTSDTTSVTTSTVFSTISTEFPTRTVAVLVIPLTVPERLESKPPKSGEALSDCNIFSFIFQLVGINENDTYTYY